MRRSVLKLFLAGAFTGLAGVAPAADLVRGQSAPDPYAWQEPALPGAFDAGYDAEPGFTTVGGTVGHFEEGTGPTSWYAPPDYDMTFMAGMQWLSRTGGLFEQTLVVEIPPLSTPLLNSESLDFEGQFRPGAIFQLGLNADQVSGVDLIYWGLNSYDTRQTLTNPSLMGLAGTLQLATNDFIFSDFFQLDYESTLHNAEANYRQTIEQGTLLIGFRYFNLDERLDILSRNANTQTSSDYIVDARNHLVGGQVGAGWHHDWTRVRLALDTKFGVFANVASQETFLGDFGNTFVRRSYRAESMPVSMISDSTLSLKTQLTDWLAFDVGYRLMWVGNVALAPNQLDLSDSPAGTTVMNAHQGLFLNGLFLGFDARW